MTPDYASPYPLSLSSVSWGAVIAGGIVAAAVSLFLLAFGSGVGFLVVSPWADRGMSATTFAWSAAIYLICVSMISSTVGGYLAGRLRRRWAVDPDEVYFRDSAHGVLTWAFALLLGASVLASATTNLLGGAAAGLAPAAATAGTSAAQSPLVEGYVDQLFRAPAPTAAPGAGQSAAPATAPALASGGAQSASDARAEVGRLFTRGLQRGGDITAADRGHLAQVVAARTGLPPAEAERRVNDVVTQAKQAADEARKAAAKLSLWLAAAMLAGALAAAFAAIEGGSLRDRVRAVGGGVEAAGGATVPVR
jgi:hypothetical protein